MSKKFPSAERAITDESVYISQHEPDSYLSEPPIGRVRFVVKGEYYEGTVESEWDYLCSTYPEQQPIAISPELKAELEAWDAASDEALDNIDDLEL